MAQSRDQRFVAPPRASSLRSSSTPLGGGTLASVGVSARAGASASNSGWTGHGGGARNSRHAGAVAGGGGADALDGSHIAPGTGTGRRRPPPSALGLGPSHGDGEQQRAAASGPGAGSGTAPAEDAGAPAETPEEYQHHRLIDDYLALDDAPPPRPSCSGPSTGPSPGPARCPADRPDSSCSSSASAAPAPAATAAAAASASVSALFSRRSRPPQSFAPVSAAAPAMASSTTNAAAAPRAIPRSSSIDSAISSVSAQSGPGHSHSSSTASNAAAAPVGTSPADIQSLIQAAGSAEALIQYMLKDKNSLAAQNAQLWRLVDKQRAMILGLNKDLERALKDKERYRKKLKEQLGMVPPLPSGLSTATVTQGPGRAMTESPAPSEDERREPTDASGITRCESVPLPERGRQGSAASSEAASTSYPVSPSASQPHYIVSSTNERAVSPKHGPQEQSGLADILELPLDKSQLHTPNESPNPSPSPEKMESADGRPGTENAAPEAPEMTVRPPSPPVSPNTIVLEPRTQPMELKKLGISTAVAPVTGLGKSPLRKAPPAPLALGKQPETLREADSEYDEDDNDDDDKASIKEIVGYEREVARSASSQQDSFGSGDKSWEATPDDKKAMTAISTAALSNNRSPAWLPPSRPAPQAPPAAQRPSSPQQGSRNRVTSMEAIGMDRAIASPVIKQQFVRAPLASPGLPSSPRPSDRPLNSPMPRSSRVMSPEPFGSPRSELPGSPKHGLQPIPPFSPGASRQSAPLSARFAPPPSAGLPSAGFSSTFGIDRPSSGNMPLLRHQKSASSDCASPLLLIQPSAVASIDSRVVSSRLRPSRASMLPGKPRSGGEDSVFTLGVFSRSSGKEILRVEKDANSLANLDGKLKKHIMYTVKVPDRSLFSGHAPARVDARRAAIDEYLAGVLGATMDESAALALCAFFSTDVVENNISSGDLSEKSSPTSNGEKHSTKITRSGYLTKRGKNFGGWKERYFVLDGPVLKYFDGPGGAHLGQIKLQHAQIGRQSATQRTKEEDQDPESQYRHAFLVLEPKRKDSSTLVRHVLCAESDKERDEWVDALVQYVERGGDSNEESAKSDRSKLKKSREGSGSSKHMKEKEEPKPAEDLRAMLYEDAVPGPAPATGTIGVEEVNRQHISPSPSNSTLSQAPSHSSGLISPVPDRVQQAKQQISGPTNGTVISDLSAWGAKSHTQTEKAMKKRSIWGFRHRSSSDLDEKTRTDVLQQPQEKVTLSRAVFGASLEEAVHLTRPAGVDVHLPSVVYRCIEYLDAKHASEEEGIFRLSGSNVVIKGLKEKFNTESDYNLLANDEYYDVHAVAGLLKLYLRELPTNVLTTERREDFVKVTEMGDKNRKVQALNNLVHNLPIENFHLLRALSKHLLRIVDNSDINKMTIRNVGIVFSPTLNIPAQVFSMFLHEYSDIFVHDGATIPSSPPPPQTPREPPQTPKELPPHSPTLLRQQPTSPALSPPPQYITFRPPSRNDAITEAPQTPGYEPVYEQLTPRPMSDGLSIPQDGKSAKARRRESSMMFMMGGNTGSAKKSGGLFSGPSRDDDIAMATEDIFD